MMNHMLFHWHRAAVLTRWTCSLLATCCALFLMSGCGGSKGPTLYTARGSITVDGKPAPGAIIVLHPVDKEQTIRPGGEADDDGEFSLTTDKSGDGAPAGEYKVAVHWLDKSAPVAPSGREIKSAMGGEGESKSDPVDRLQGRYSNPETSGLKCTIPEESNTEIPTFDLKSDYGTPLGPGGQEINQGA